MKEKLYIKRRTIWLIAIITLAFFAIDQVVKFFIESNLAERIEIIPGIFSFVVQHNIGVAFSISIPYLVQLVLFPLLIIVGMYVVIENIDVNKPFVTIIIGVILGGAFGNFVDRLMVGYVVDYISVYIFPVFNLADIGIVVGIFLLVLFYGKIKRV